MLFEEILAVAFIVFLVFVVCSVAMSSAYANFKMNLGVYQLAVMVIMGLPAILLIIVVIFVYLSKRGSG